MRPTPEGGDSIPHETLDVAAAAELAEMLQFISDWLARDPARLSASLEEFVGHPAYGITQLRQDLHRFTFLLGGGDGERLFGRSTTYYKSCRRLLPVTPRGRRGRGCGQRVDGGIWAISRPALTSGTYQVPDHTEDGKHEEEQERQDADAQSDECRWRPCVGRREACRDKCLWRLQKVYVARSKDKKDWADDPHREWA